MGTTDGLMLPNVWQEAMADPDDDGLRSVLADALQAAGDPLGELMSLQLLPADPEQAPARRARIRELVQTHHVAWLGPLYELARGARFDRGFVTRISVTKPPWSETDLRWAIDEPVYAQVRELCYPRFLEVELHAMVAYLVRELPALRAVEVDRVSVLESVERARAPIQHVACLAACDQDRGVMDRLIQVLKRRPQITELSITPWMFGELARQPSFERLSRVAVTGGVRAVLALWPRLPSHTTLVITPRHGLDTCELAFPDYYRIELRRDGTARIGGEWLMYPLEVLRDLPPEIRRLELEDTSEPIVARIREALRDRAIEIAVVGDDGRAGNITWR